MKKRLQGLIAGVLIGATITGGAVFATNTTTLYDVIVNGIKIVLDGKEFICTDANGAVVQPMIYNGTTYIPVRAVSSAFGKAVFWDEENIFDNYGNFYDTCVHYKNSLSDEFANICCEVLLNKKYSKFKATLFVPEGSSWDGESSIKIIGDGKLLYENVMNKTSEPVDIEVPITGVNNFKILFGDETETYIANGGFYQ